jgi:hypothetical protein
LSFYFPSLNLLLFLFCSILTLHSFFLFHSILFCLSILFFNSHPVFSVLPLVSSLLSLFLIMLTHKSSNRERAFFLLFFFFFFSYFTILFFLSFRFIFPSYICLFFLFLFIINSSFFLLISLHSFSSFDPILSHSPFLCSAITFILPSFVSDYEAKFSATPAGDLPSYRPPIHITNTPFQLSRASQNKYGWPAVTRYTANL